MTPEMRARITARNETAQGFAEVKRDAVATANAIETSGDRAAASMMRQNTALVALGTSSRLAASQSRNLVFQLQDIGVSLASGMNPLMVFAQQGTQIAAIYGPEEGGLGRALKETGNLAVGLVTKFAPIIGILGLATGAIAGMTAEINKASDVQVGFGDVALATWQVFSEGVYNFVKPAIDAVVGWLGSIWDVVRPALVNLGNGLVATFVGAFDAIKAIWGMLPAVMGDIAITTANAVIGGIESMVNGAIELINGLIRNANGALGAVGLSIGELGSVELGEFANPFAGVAGEAGVSIGEAFANAFGTDFLGEAFDAIKTKAIELASATDTVATATKNLGGALKDNKTWADAFFDVMGKGVDKSTTSILGAFGQLTGALGQLFNDNKAFAVATAVINTAEGITKALAQGGLLGFVGAAAVAASGAAQIASILSAQPGTSSAPSVGGSAPAAGAGATAGPSTAVNITLSGNGSYSRDQVANLVGQIGELFADKGVKINLVPIGG